MSRRQRTEGLRSVAAADAGAPSQRQLRVGELLRHALAEVLARETIRDPIVAETAITITEVRPAPDLRSATCYVMPLGGRNADLVCAALQRLAPWLASQVSRRVRLKFAPLLRFCLDGSFDEADRIRALLKRPDVAADIERAGGGEDTNGA